MASSRDDTEATDDALDAVLDHIEEHRGELTSLTLDLLAFDTQNPPGETRSGMEFVADYLGEYGIRVDTVGTDPAKPNVVARVPGRTDRTFLLNGHLDTVPYDRERWAYEPTGEQVEDKIYGRGATDMKGPLAAMLLVMAGYASSDAEPPLDLALAVVSDEEVPSANGLDELVADDVIDADACVIGETTCEAGRFSLTVADKGSIWLTLRATGTSAHGSRPMMGENAIERLYEAIVDLRYSLTQRTLSIDPALEPVIEESIEYYTPTIGHDRATELFRYPTVNLGHLEGGESINTVPETATAELDIRLTAGVDTERVLSDIRTCLERHEGVSIMENSWSVGTYEPPDEPLVAVTAETASEVVGEKVFLRSATGGGDAKTLRNDDIATVEFGVGTETVHAVDEFITTDALSANAEIYARLPVKYAERIDQVPPSNQAGE